MEEAPDFRKAWFSCDSLYELREELKCQELAPVVTSFGDGILRMHSTLMMLPSALGFAYMQVTAEAEAAHQLMGIFEPPDSMGLNVNIVFAINEILKRKFEEVNQGKRVQPSVQGMHMLEMIVKHHDLYGTVRAGMESTLASLLINAWTTFEVLTSDLWIAALDHGSLTLSENVVDSAGKGKLGGDKQQQKSFTIDVFSVYKYDFRKSMGTLLINEEKVSFQSFKNVIAAYQSAFRSDEIESILNEDDEDVAHILLLEAVRNLMVHKRSICDYRFLSKLKSIKSSSLDDHFRGLQVNQKFEVDGSLVNTLVASVLKVSNRLIRYVDDVVSSSKPPAIEFQI